MSDNAVKIETLHEFIDWLNQLDEGAYLFRGVSRASYDIEASACRCLPEEYRRNRARLLALNERLIKDARIRGHDEKDGRQLSDLELLAELQHYGAATCLIDFSRNALVALWMACQKSTGDKQDNGKVVAICSDDTSRFEIIDHKLLGKDVADFFVDKDKGVEGPDIIKSRPKPSALKTLYQWQPKYQNHRIIAQFSVFIFGDTNIDTEKTCEIVVSRKSDILKALKKLSGISEESMYPDFDGFARLNAQ